MVNIQYFVDKVKAERDAAAGPSAGENPICASNGEVGTRPGASHSIFEIRKRCECRVRSHIRFGRPQIRIACFGRRERILGDEGNSAGTCERSTP